MRPRLHNPFGLFDRRLSADGHRRVLPWSGRGPVSWRSCRATFAFGLHVEMLCNMCTGMRIVRAWSATARVIAWRIHQVA